MSFEPIAIVGRGCVLPGALTPDELWTAISEGRNLLSSAPAGSWGLDHAQILTAKRPPPAETSVTDRGGYISDFDASFDPSAYDCDPDWLQNLDPVFRWLLHVNAAALGEAGVARTERNRAGLVLGNLSYPTRSLVDLATDVWSGEGGVFENRFSSGYPAHLSADLLGLGGEAIALDAACASSLYAIKIACDRLHSGEADIMLAAATNNADDLFLHVGFTALQALSPSGQSRPFHRGADGLLPAHGAACVVLQRLCDAVAEGRHIYGVIRAVGLSNDGRAGGFLAPDRDGQYRAMQSAYDMSGLDPADIGLMECHATGTSVGDSAEIDSMARIFVNNADVPVGSMKSNMGHLITVAGLGALLKVTSAMAAGIRPQTLHAEEPVDAFQGTPFRPLQEAEEWPVGDAPRRAGINAFGFGGNNAHLIVEQWNPSKPQKSERRSVPVASSLAAAVTAIGAVTAAGRGSGALIRSLFSGRPGAVKRVESAHLPLRGLRYPPKDIAVALGQQTLVMEAVFQIADQLEGLAPERIGCLVGTGCDPEGARFAQRLRFPELCESDKAAGSGLVPLLAPDTIGTMPNIPANRLNNQFNWQGFGFTVSAEELSGVAALRLAARALINCEVDAVVVGAAETPGDRVHEAALKALWPADLGDPGEIGDAAVVMVLRRPGDLEDMADCLACVDMSSSEEAGLSVRQSIAARFGNTHAADGLLQVAAAVLASAHGRDLSSDDFVPDFSGAGHEMTRLTISSFTGHKDHLAIKPVLPFRGTTRQAPVVGFYRGGDHADLIRQIESGVSGGDGDLRLSILAEDVSQFEVSLKQAIVSLQRGELPAGENLWSGQGTADGELAFVFPGAAAAYRGMGRSFYEAFPDVAGILGSRHAVVQEVATGLYRDNRVTEQFDQLKGCALVCQGHAIAARQILGLEPDAIIGLSSGETNGLFAMEVWRDMGDMFEEIAASEMYGRYLTGTFDSARESWGDAVEVPVDWVAWRILGSEDAVRAALADEDRAAMTIINAPNDCVVAGAGDAVRRVVQKLNSVRVVDLGHPMVVHCAGLAPYADKWRVIHTRRTHGANGVRFYANHTGRAYKPSRKLVAENLTGQALNCVDFPRTIRQAYADGVRCFVELGPRDTSTSAIRSILADQPHSAMAFDTAGKDGLESLVRVAARLFADGYLKDPSDLLRRLDRMTDLSPALTETGTGSRDLKIPIHQAPVNLYRGAKAKPDEGGTISASVPQTMPKAPVLPSISDLPPFIAAPEPVRINKVTPAAVSSAATASVAGQTPAEIMLRVHQQYVVRQTESYQQFLSMQSRLMSGGNARVEYPGAKVAADEPATTGSPANDFVGSELSGAALQPVESRSTVVFDRADLEILASGKVSDILGPLFRQQDEHRIQVRMPEPPLLLVDRVTALTGEAGSMGTGYIETETDVADDAWYLHRGAMTPGAIIESGQADLLLISWLGIDFLNRGKRAYRLLGCELTFHEGGLPLPGDTLRYGIHVDGHAKTGDVRLFFFHYDCHIGDRLLLSVREGQAGFFTEAELATSGGVLWDAADDKPLENACLDKPHPVSTKRTFSAADLTALIDGDALTCFGPGFEAAAPHQRTPAPPGGQLRMIDSVTCFEPDGGPWGRGYLRAETHVPADHWFYDGHFLNDPCMPGTLMADAAVQALSITLAAYGYGLKRDGWRFEPAPGEAFKFICRGQVTPDREHLLTYEVFVEEIIDGPHPVIRAALLCKSDGFKVFQCRRFALRLVPDWPYKVDRPVNDDVLVGTDRSVPGDYPALLACAWGKPSDAFGEMYRRFDGPYRVPRLPGPPYHFISRIRSVDCPAGQATVEGTLQAEYQPPSDAWYFQENGSPVMPYGVLMEVLLQPCGWLASYMGFALTGSEVAIRNLDGDSTVVHAIVTSGSGLIETKVRLTRFARVGDLTVIFFRVESSLDGAPLMEMNTSFGFFTAQALANQSGLSVNAALRERLAEPSDVLIDLSADSLAGDVPVAAGKYRMIDQITGYWPEGGEAGLGRIRGRQKVNPGAWYFKAHFYQDPVQPGSLGIEALVQLLQIYCRLSGRDTGFETPVFEPFALGERLVWKYRGQVLPHNWEVFSDLEITRAEQTETGLLICARGSLWVDKMRIYEVSNLAVRIVEARTLNLPLSDASMPKGEGFQFSLTSDPWIADHCPTHTIPALPFMVLVDLLAQAVLQHSPHSRVIGLEDVKVFRWATVVDQIALYPEVTAVAEDCWFVTLKRTDGDDLPVAIAEGHVRTGSEYPPRPEKLPPLRETEVQPDPYNDGCLFHGSAFQVLNNLRLSADGACFTLDAGQGPVPRGALHPRLLDGMLHGIPHDRLETWFPAVSPGGLGYPVAARSIRFFADMPASGSCEVQIQAVSGEGSSAEFKALLSDQQGVIAEMQITEAVVPQGTLGRAPAADRKAFLGRQEPVSGLRLSWTSGGVTCLDGKTVQQSNWLSGTLEQAYGVEGDMRSLIRTIAIKEHVADCLGVHPVTVTVTGNRAICGAETFDLTEIWDGNEVRISFA